MDIEFHYYLTNLIAQRAGFSTEDSEKLAYASQYVDDNQVSYDVKDEQGKDVVYTVQPSQTMNPLRPRLDQLEIYGAFHFVPGDPTAPSAQRRDGLMSLLNTTPNSKRAQFLMGEALSSNDIYRIGIATHCYADTWAHQNFTGMKDCFNGMSEPGKKIVPDIGHADAGHQPDIPGLVWHDNRLRKDHREIHNKQRFIDASEAIFKKFKEHNDPGCKTVDQEWAALKADIDWAIGSEFQGKDRNRSARMKRYQTLIHDGKKYDEHEWRNVAVESHVRGLPDGWIHMFRDFKLIQDSYRFKPGAKHSDWMKFEDAVKVHLQTAKKASADIFAKTGVNPHEMDGIT